MITKRLSIMLGVATATVGVALLAPVSSATAGGGGASHRTEPLVLYAKGCCPKSVPFVLSSNFH
jgi:hypothetical protein